MVFFSRLVRIFETVRHLSAEQWGYRFINRGERILRARFPKMTFQGVLRRSRFLPKPNPGAPSLQGIVDIVRLLHTSIHGEYVEHVSGGCFTFLNRTVDFGSIEQIRWRRDLGEGNNPLWIMNLAYLGWSIPFVERGGSDALKQVSKVILGLEEQNGFEVNGVFRDVWNAYTASHRLINLLTCLAIYENKYGKVDVSSYEVILKHIIFCASYVSKSLEKDLQYNHLLKNYVALTVFSTACVGGAQIFPFLERSVEKSIRQQVLPDGGHSERSPMYNVLSYLDLNILGRSKLYKSWSFIDDDIIPKMALALRVQSHPDGDVALFNDSWLGEAPTVEAILGREDLVDRKSTLIDTGYTKISDVFSSAVVFDHGACGPNDNPGHAHADFLSFEMSVRRVRFFVDPGTPTYSAGVLRDLSRSASCHNGPSFEGLEPIDFWSSFRIGRRGRGRLVCVDSELDAIAVAGTHDGYEFAKSGVARLLAFFPGVGVLVVDIWSGSAARAQSRFLVSSAWELVAPHSFCRQLDVVECRAIIGVLSDVEVGECWPRFGAREDAHAFTLVPEEHDGLRVASIWCGWGGECPLNVEGAMSMARKLAVACSAPLPYG